MASTRTRHTRMFSSSEDNAMMKNILATHSPDGTYIDVIPLLQIIEDIMRRAHPGSSHDHDPQAKVDTIVESVIYNDDVNDQMMLEVMALTVNMVSCEISCKCTGGGDTTTGIFNILSNYGWDAKAVVTLAAFAMNYGEFWLVAQLHNANPLAKSLAQLKQLSDVLEPRESLTTRLNTVTNLIKAMLDLAHCIIRFKELPERYISPDTPELVTATTRIPIAVYWIITSIVACSSILTDLSIGMGHEHMTTTTEAWELSSLAHKISNIHDHLEHHLDLCNRHINEKKHIEAYLTIIRVMDTPHLDNTKPLKHLIYLKDDQQPLYESSTKNRVSIDILKKKKKIVLLLISDLDLSPEELSVLDQMYREARQNPTRPESQYEVVWLPVVSNQRTTPWTEENQNKFEELRNMMPWYSVFHPSLLDPAVIKYIKEVWHFNHKPLLVVMDPQGRIVNTNGLHMMLIWGSVAFPFTSMREEALWREETWRIELLADSIEPMISNWVTQGKYICLYGGEDIEWIRKFTRTAQAVARQAGIPLEMLYVGKSNPREKVLKCNDIIRAENLSYVLDSALIWFFWVRLESMLHSKLQYGKSFDEDPVLREINVMLTYDGNDRGWAVICRGSNEWMRRVNGDTVLTSLTNYEEWQDEAEEMGFLSVLNDHLEANRPPHHCNRLILPGTTGSVPERVVCAECVRLMERFFLYRCCTD